MEASKYADTGTAASPTTPVDNLGSPLASRHLPSSPQAAASSPTQRAPEAPAETPKPKRREEIPRYRPRQSLSNDTTPKRALNSTSNQNQSSEARQDDQFSEPPTPLLKSEPVIDPTEEVPELAREPTPIPEAINTEEAADVGSSNEEDEDKQVQPEATDEGKEPIGFLEEEKAGEVESESAEPPKAGQDTENTEDREIGGSENQATASETPEAAVATQTDIQSPAEVQSPLKEQEPIDTAPAPIDTAASADKPTEVPGLASLDTAKSTDEPAPAPAPGIDTLGSQDKPTEAPGPAPIDTSESTEDFKPSPIDTAKTIEAPDPAPAPVETQNSTEAPKPAPIDTAKSPVTGTPTRSKTPGSAKSGLKKVLSKRGKPCIIRVPAVSVYTKRSYIPMSMDEVKARLQQFEEQGYHVGGFDHSIVHEANVDMEAPPAADVGLFTEFTKREGTASPPKAEIRIPDKQKWDSYVNDLMEQKLKALGVSIGTDTPEIDSQPDLSRKNSESLIGLATSPPAPSSSAMSQPMLHGSMPFSAPFSPGATTNNTSIVTYGSPVPSITSPHGVAPPMVRQSSFGPGFPGQTQYPQSFSPQLPNGALINARSPSAGWTQNLQRLPSALSQASPDPFMDRQQTPRGLGESKQSSQVSVSKNSSQPTGVSGSAPNTNPHTPEAETLSWLSKSEGQKKPMNNDDYGQLAFPTPKGHRQNISVNLERAAEQAEYYPGEYVEQNNQVDPSMDSHYKPPFQQPALFNTEPFRHQSALSQASNSSASKLNVEAKEFTFGGDAGHMRSFSIPKSSFAPQLERNSTAVSLITAHANGEATGGGNFAQEYKPPRQKDFPFSAANFDFTANLPQPPTLKSNDFGQEGADESKTGVKEPEPKPGIFGRILADIVKPTRKSKAIPIVDPKTLQQTESSDDDDQEDESGRPMPNSQRFKRGRLQASDADDVPKFDVPRNGALSRELKELANETNSFVPSEKSLLYSESDNAGDPWHDLDEKDFRPAEQGKATDAQGTDSEQGVTADDSTAAAEKSLLDEPIPEEQPLDPEFQELDAIMDKINEQEQDFPQVNAPTEPQNLFESENTNAAAERGDLPQRPVNELKQTSSMTHKDALGVSAAFPPDWVQDNVDTRRSDSPVKKLNRNKTPVSDWDDMLPPGEEKNFFPQANFFDFRVKSLIGEVLRDQLAPIQQRFNEMAVSLAKVSDTDKQSPRAISRMDRSNSDADDEDAPESSPGRSVHSRKADKRMEQIKSAIHSAVANVQPTGIDELINGRLQTEEKAAELQKLLELSEREIRLFKESVSENETKVRALGEEKETATNRISELEKIERELRGKNTDLSREVSSLGETLDEYRTSANKWREELDSVKESRESMKATVETLKKESREHQQAKDATNSRLQKVQETLGRADHALVTERGEWRKRDEASAKDLTVIGTKLDEAMRANERLERDVERLTNAEKEALRVQVTLDELENNHARLTAENVKLRHDVMSSQDSVAHYEREAKEAKDIARAEIQRISTLLKGDVDNAENKVASLQEDFEERLKAAKEELHRERERGNEVKQNYRESLEELKNARESAIQEAVESAREAAEVARATLSQERQLHEEAVADLSAQYERKAKEAIDSINGIRAEERRHYEATLDDMTEQHERALRAADESTERSRTEERRMREQAISDLSQRHEQALREALQSAENSHNEERTLHENMLAQLQEHYEKAAREAAESSERNRTEQRRLHEDALADIQEKHKHILNESNKATDSVRADEQRLHEKQIKDMQEKHEKALADATTSARKAQETDRTRHQGMLADMKATLSDMKEKHERTLSNAKEDRTRSEKHLNGALELANERNALLEDKVAHLEEKVSVAQSAAQAAASAAQGSARNIAQDSATMSPGSKGSPSAARAQGPPEKISPQALRESIMVLQEQLQEREGRIESLEAQLSDLEEASPEKLKARETEITWLRELLGVRVDDLTEICKLLASDNYDRNTVRDAAIRIRATLQMEQHVKERAIANLNGQGTPAQFKGPALPSLTDIQNFATPKAAQLAAAWGQWRKGQGTPSLSSLKDVVNGSSPSRNLQDPDATPSRPSTQASQNVEDSPNTDAQKFLSGLMTPPATNLRKTPSTSGASNYQSARSEYFFREQNEQSAEPMAPATLQLLEDEFDGSEVGSPTKARPQTEYKKGHTRSRTRGPIVRQAQREILPMPPLLREDDYDKDATIGSENLSSFGEEDEQGVADKPENAPLKHLSDELANMSEFDDTDSIETPDAA